MLQSLHVKNLALIREEDVDFSPGLLVFTGETGAGKSVLLGSVELFLNGKTDKGLIRRGQEEALIELTFTGDLREVNALLAENGITTQENEVLLTKKITAAKSISRVNGETTAAAILQKAAAMLITLHGQQDTGRLLNAKEHEKMLDAYAGEPVKALANEVALAYRTVRQLTKALAEEALSEEERRKKEALLRFEIEDIAAANPLPGEDTALEEEYRKLENGKSLSDACEQTKEAVSAEGGALDAVGASLKALSAALSFDESLRETYGNLSAAEDILSEASRSLERYLDTFAYAPERLMQVKERLDVINRLKDRYAPTLEGLLSVLESKQAEAEALLHYEENLEKKRRALQLAEETLLEKATALSGLRKTAAGRFETELKAALTELNFPAVSFSVRFTQRKAPEADGMDTIAFFIALNPGEEEKPLSSVASGGELSRIMLAIRTVMADKDHMATLVFDEIDAGISGRTAQKVAEKLKRIAGHHQVLCITHLAQIAAMADTHYLIRKDITQNTANTVVKKTTRAESVEELARILGGKEITASVRKAAEEMKQMGETNS